MTPSAVAVKPIFARVYRLNSDVEARAARQERTVNQSRVSRFKRYQGALGWFILTRLNRGLQPDIAM
jgi:hypothetical protein